MAGESWTSASEQVPNQSRAAPRRARARASSQPHAPVKNAAASRGRRNQRGGPQTRGSSDPRGDRKSRNDGSKTAEWTASLSDKSQWPTPNAAKTLPAPKTSPALCLPRAMTPTKLRAKRQEEPGKTSQPRALFAERSCLVDDRMRQHMQRREAEVRGEQQPKPTTPSQSKKEAMDLGHSPIKMSPAQEQTTVEIKALTQPAAAEKSLGSTSPASQQDTEGSSIKMCPAQGPTNEEIKAFTQQEAAEKALGSPTPASQQDTEEDWAAPAPAFQQHQHQQDAAEKTLGSTAPASQQDTEDSPSMISDGSSEVDATLASDASPCERQSLSADIAELESHKYKIQPRRQPTAPALRSIRRSSSATAKYINKVMSEKEIQRINCCRSAVNILDLSSDQNNQSVVIAFLEKALLVHPHRWEHSDAEFAFSRLTAAYTHHVNGTSWSHCFESDDAASNMLADNFAVFQEVVKTAEAEADDFPEPDLVKDCLGLLDLQQGTQ